jgi:pilus assembly protein Flp/PilA
MVRRFLSRFGRDDGGATAIEYGLIAALIFVVILSAVAALGGKTDAMYDYITAAVASATA